MILRLLPIVALLTGCVAIAPAPVKDAVAPTRVEAGRAGAAKAAGLYTVKKGDTLYSIALDHGVDYRDLVAWNGIDNPNRIRLGQQLRVAPASGTGTAEKPAVITDGVSEIRPISSGGAPVARSLDEPAAAKPAPAVSPAPTFAADTEKLKRSPKGGKLPYSEENLAKLKALEAAGAPAPLPVQEKPPEKPVVAEKPAAPPVTAIATEIDWAWPSAGKILAPFSDGSGEANKGVDIAGKIGEPVQAAAAGKVIYVGTMNKYGNLVIVLHGAGNSSVYAHNSKILVKEGQMVTRGQKIAELGDSDADQPKLHFEIRQQGKPVDPLKFLPPR